MDGREARTAYELMQTFADPVEASLLTCKLETGRTHQIRVHMSSIGHAVLGDSTYSGVRSSFAVPRPMLHASVLGFDHPGTGEPVSFTVEPPQDFAEVLARLS
jgi:23S rRNA pseudouridine1911/1915/1917 synthase